MPKKQKRSGSIGGAADEAGGLYRRSVAALFVAYGLNGTPFLGLPIRETDAIVDAVALETDFAWTISWCSFESAGSSSKPNGL